MDNEDKIMEEKFAYWYDKKTGEYKGIRKRQFHNGKYLIPGSCTLEKVPEQQSGKIVIRNQESKKWKHVKDCRGIIYYNKETKQELKCQEIEFINDEYTENKPPVINEYQNTIFNNDKWNIEDKAEIEIQEIIKQEKYNIIKSQLLDKIIWDAIENPDSNDNIKVWINNIYNQENEFEKSRTKIARKNKNNN